MNARQAAKKAAKHITDLEYFNKRASADIKALNIVIDGMIAGESPCKWCAEKESGECTRPELDGKGCEEWMLMWEHGIKGEEIKITEMSGETEKGDADDGEAVSESGDTGREGSLNVEGATGTL